MKNRMEKELNKKLKKYSTVSGAMLLGNINLQAQISYTDLSPDLILHDMTNVYPIDFDGDLQDDFNFFAGFGSQTGLFSTGPYYGLAFIDYQNGAMAGAININNEFIVDSSNNNDALNFNSSINALQQFNNFYTYLTPLAFKNTRVAQTVSFSSTSLTGVWHGQTDKYLGLRFQIGSNMHYGWIRMDVTANCDSIIIKDYAFNSVPNQGILAGQIVTSVNENAVDFSVHTYNGNLFINRNINELEQLQMLSLDGKLIFVKQLNTSFETISIADLPKGIYLVQIGNTVKKIII